MNDEEKIFAVSELFVVEMENWTRTVEEYSDEEKLSEIKRLRLLLVIAKENLEE
jgi:hypothetical protein